MPASRASARSVASALASASSSRTASSPAACGCRAGAECLRVRLRGGLAPGGGVAELRQAPVDRLAAGLDGVEVGGRGLHGVPGRDLLGALPVELPGARAANGGQHGRQAEALEPLDVLLLSAVRLAQPREVLAGGRPLLPQLLELAAQVHRLVVVGDGAVEGVSGGHGVWVSTGSIMALRGGPRTLGSMSVSLGMPPLPPPVVAPRRASRKIRVGKVEVGGDAPVSVQSMTTTPTTDINATLQQIAELTASGCDIVRVACPSQDDAEALPAIARKSQIPVIADIHFQPKYVYAAIDAGCAAVRVNPGNIRQFDDQVGEIARRAKAAGVSIRIGVNAGSLDKRLLEKYGKPTAEALVESAVWEASLFEEHDFHDFKISVKHNDPVVMVRAYQMLAERGDWPLHLGVTEAGPAFQGTIKSATAFGALLSQGIGDTIRVSLSAPPVEEVKVGNQILQSLNLRPRKLEIVSCPSCGRAQVDVYTLADEVTAGLEGMTVPLRVAVMGCVVNGPGEAREADLGVASGNGKGQIFVKGEVIKTVPESQIVETLIEEAMRMAEEMGEPVDEESAGAPSVTVG